MKSFWKEKKSRKKKRFFGIVKGSLEAANEAITGKTEEKPELKQMGTTLEICLIYNNRAYIGHIGDSRIYRIRKNIIRRITTDHSYVQELVNDGTITKEEAFLHPKKNMLMKAIGCGAFLNPDVMVRGFLEDDVILMCSDGLTNMITEEEIKEIILKDTENAVDTLIDKANSLGGYDNISVVIIDSKDENTLDVEEN